MGYLSSLITAIDSAVKEYPEGAIPTKGSVAVPVETRMQSINTLKEIRNTPKAAIEKSRHTSYKIQREGELVKWEIRPRRCRCSLELEGGREKI